MEPELVGVGIVNGGYWLTWVEENGRVWNEVCAHPPYFFLIDGGQGYTPGNPQ